MKEQKIKNRNELDVDEAIKSEREDRYHRTHIADYFANLLINYNNSKSFVAGIEGDWGCGKTSFNNLVKEKIKENNLSKEIKIHIIDFNPWSCKNTDEMYERFLKEVINNCDNLFSKVINIVKVLVKIIAFIIITCTIIFYSNEEYFLSIEFCNKIIDIFKKFNILTVFKLVNIFTLVYLANIKNIIKLIFPNFKINILERLQLKVNRKLKNNKLIVFIDDVDRINITSLIKLFSLINIVLNFNNVIFILSYDRNYIKKLLKNFHDPEQYLEKIIQIKLDLPKIDKDDLKRNIENLFLDVLDYHLQDYNDIVLINKIKKIYSTNLLEISELFSELLNTPRQIALLRNEIALKKLILKEVNPFDFMIISFIKIFDYSVYEKLRESIDIDDLPKKAYSIFNPSDNKIDLKPFYDNNNKYFKKLIKLLFNDYSLDDLTNSNLSIFSYKRLRFNFSENESKKRYFKLRIMENDYSRIDFIKMFNGKNQDYIDSEINKNVKGRTLGDVLLYFNYFNSFLDHYVNVNVNILIKLINESYINFCEKKYFYGYKNREDFFMNILYYDSLFSDIYISVLNNEIKDSRFFLMIKIYIKIYSGKHMWDSKNYSKIENWINNNILNYLDDFKQTFNNENSELNLFIAYHLQTTNVSTNSELSKKYQTYFKDLFKVEKNILLLMGERYPELDILPDDDNNIEIFINKFHMQMNLSLTYGDDIKEFTEEINTIINNIQDQDKKESLINFRDIHLKS